jgi:hypothetical protein
MPLLHADDGGGVAAEGDGASEHAGIVREAGVPERRPQRPSSSSKYRPSRGRTPSSGKKFRVTETSVTRMGLNNI